jgi:hypothetical protein
VFENRVLRRMLGPNRDEVTDERKGYRVLVGKPEGKGPLGKRRRRWEDGIRIDLRENGWGVV